MKRTLALLLLLGVVVSGRDEDAASLRQRATAALAQTSGEITVAGLSKPVEVIRDRWGVPHIYAQTVDDLFFAQGFVAAQDRLWQLDLWRRTGEGRLAEALGPSALARDVFARLVRYRGDMEAEWRSYLPNAKPIVHAFVQGINAHVALVKAQPDRLPLEFQLLGIEPEAWTPQTVISRMAGYVMTRNASSEVRRAQLVRTAGPALVSELLRLDPPTPIVVPQGLDLADITDDILGMAREAGSSIRFGDDGEIMGSAAAGSAAPVSTARARWPFTAPWLRGSRAPTLETEDDPGGMGSNNWVVSGALSATGRPLLANDPHRSILLPSLRYTVHLNGPGWNVIGAGEPALPGVSIGHNDRMAFGLTIVGIDQQDLYVEQLHPTDSNYYSYKGQWEPMRVERELFTIRGEASREIELRFTRHGPVLHVDHARRRAYALRWVGSEPGTAGYLGSLALNVARSWPEFLKATERWKVPSENLVYADVDGNIGWVAAGLTPVRPNWNGLLPVPGHEGRYEWSGFLPIAELPQQSNPASGFIATANHNILPAGYTRTLGHEFSAPHRFNRIQEVLGGSGGVNAPPAGRRFTVADFERLQHDELSVVARSLGDALRRAMRERPELLDTHPDRARGARMLAEWNHVLGRDSAAAALYEIWLGSVAGRFAERLATASADDRSAMERLLAMVRVDRGEYQRVLIERLLERLRENPAPWFDVLLGPALEEAWREAGERMGPDPARWAWGRIHAASLQHAVATTPARREVMNLAEVPRGGDGTTPNSTGSGPRQTSGASYRQVIDLADWDRSTTINVPGLSGQPGSPHYGDLLPLWAGARYHPMPFTRAAVERHASARLVLKPAGAGQ